MSGTALLSEIIALLVGGISSMAEGIGTGLSNLAESIFLTTTGDVTTLSTFGTIVVIFAGISLAIGLSKLVCGWIASLGGRNV